MHPRLSPGLEKEIRRLIGRGHGKHAVARMVGVEELNGILNASDLTVQVCTGDGRLGRQGESRPTTRIEPTERVIQRDHAPTGPWATWTGPWSRTWSEPWSPPGTGRFAPICPAPSGGNLHEQLPKELPGNLPGQVPSPTPAPTTSRLGYRARGGRRRGPVLAPRMPSSCMPTTS